MNLVGMKDLILWSKNQYSDLPWRKKRTLYKTLVSEIMLQQTTVGTVLNHFDRFLSEYPTLNDLANATEEEICISWKGLGYYRRARNLRNLAIQIVENFKGEIPKDLDSLLSLKGVGPYTANALVSIGADKKALAVDANLERVLARYYGIKTPKGLKLQKDIWSRFEKGVVLPEMNELSARALNEALMDLGRITCQAKKASCMICPLSGSCKAKKNGEMLLIPVYEGEKKPSAEHVLKLLRVVVKDQNKILVYQKNQNEWLSNQWELPTFTIETTDEKVKQYPFLKKNVELESLVSIKTTITKYNIQNYIFEVTLKDFNKMVKGIDREFHFKELNSKLNLSTASMKVLKKIN